MTGRIAQAYRRMAEEGRITPDAAQLALLPLLDELRTALARSPAEGGIAGLFRKAPQPAKGIYLWGGVGRGKSMLMDLFFAAAPEPKRRVHFHAFMRDFHHLMFQQRRVGGADPLPRVVGELVGPSRLLAFDEMQITDITDAMIIGRIFRQLVAAGVTIVTTSNRPPEDLYKDGLNRGLFLPFIAFLRQELTLYQLDGTQDHRIGHLDASRRYLVPADAAARAAMDGLFAELAGGAGEPLTLAVQGREVVLPRFRNGVARASFATLCARPLGPADYLAIADAVRVLILEGVPRLDRSRANEARRLVTLIDALYEARAQLAVTAEAAPDDLYPAGEGSFEFARTASRLKEMQREDWPAGPASPSR